MNGGIHLMKHKITSKLVAFITALIMVLSTMNMVYAVGIGTKAGSESLTFATLSDNTVKVTGCKAQVSGSLTIPSEYDGKTVTQIDMGAFGGSDLLTKVVIPDTVTDIGAYAFENCIALQSIAIPDSVKSIGYGAFGHTGITTATIGSGTESIGIGAFASCENLKEISVSASNKKYTSDNGVLFDKEQKVLISYPAAKTGEYIVPVSVEEIADMAFEGAKNLSKATLNYGLKKIGDYAFAYAGIKNITIPSSVSQIGEGAFSGCEALSEISWPYSVSAVENRTFEGCLNLTSVVLPEGVKTISDMAFIDCIGLKEIVLPDTLTTIGSSAFRNCKKLETVVLPEGLTSIGNNAFMHASQLKSANFKGVPPTNFGGNVFTGTSIEFVIGYTESNAKAWAPKGETTWNGYSIVKFDEANIDIPEDAQFEYMLVGGNAVITGYKGTGGEVTVPATIGNNYTVTAIDDYAFAFSKITKITLPDTVTSIGTEAFSYCAQLTSVSFGTGLSTLGIAIFASSPKVATLSVASGNSVYQVIDNAIYTKDGLALVVCAPASTGKFTVKEGTVNVAASAFESCEKIQEIVLPSTVKSIGNYAFFGCSALKQINLGNQINSIGESAFYMCKSLTEIVLPTGISNIGDNTFTDCTALKNVYLQEGVKTIGYAAFASCTALETLTIPDGVEKIGESAFNGCSSLKTVFVGATVENIGSYAFRDAKSLTSAVFYGEPPISFGERVFDEAASAFTIYYPENYKLSWAPNGETTWNGYPIKVYENAVIPTPTPTSTPTATPTVTPTVTPTPGEEVTEGDVNGDGKVNSRDIAALQKHIVEIEILTGTALKAADVSGDGKVNSRDIAALQKKIAG